jgi:hypothetical protein
MPLQLDQTRDILNLGHHETEPFEVMLEGVLENLECLNLLFLLILLRFMNSRLFCQILIVQLLAYAIILSIIIFHEIPKIFRISLLACQLRYILLVFSDLEYLVGEDFDDFIVSFLPFYI